MCGIFGITLKPNYGFSEEFVKEIANELFILSETRGKEAAGIAFNDGNKINVFKEAVPPSEFINNDNYLSTFNSSIKQFKNNKKYNNNIDTSFSLIGHSRLVTNGFQCDEKDNQPVIISDIVGIHNGIITNENSLWEKHKDLNREFIVDSEVIFKLFSKYLNQNKSTKESVIKTFSELKGSASIAAFGTKSKWLTLATNTGSIFYIINNEKSFFAFASEKYILNELIKFKKFKNKLGSFEINQIKANFGFKLNLKNLENNYFSLEESISLNNNFKYEKDINDQKLNLIIKNNTKNPKKLLRCNKCVLPETYPFIDLDKNGVCRYCRSYKPYQVKGENILLEKVKKYKSKDGSPDCLVPLSGGRDSCFGLHYVKKVLGMNPIAFTYDWGFVTDLARRNAARICGKLGVELIIRSPNIATKRRYVRNNVSAWLKQPELGMIPLFMAGDKAFYYFARQLKKETGIKLVFFSTGNIMENCAYKFGFSGLRDGEVDNLLIRLKFKNKLKLIYYYLKNFVKNPRYLNESLFDTAAAYWHTFIGKDDFIHLYHYKKWKEDEIVNTIINEYEWEISQDTKTTWRIGDASAAFYNYIYYTMAGFTEDDDMLSHMVRENYISRDEALKRSLEFAKPRIESIKEYTQMIGLNYEETLSTINSAKKLY